MTTHYEHAMSVYEKIARECRVAQEIEGCKRASDAIDRRTPVLRANRLKRKPQNKGAKA